jgi:hypothetical protein
MISQMPFFVRPFFTPDFETALMPDFEKKIERMARICSQEDVVMLGGVPTWTVVLFRRMLELTGKQQFKQFFPGEKVSYQEVYNASEGYFAIQDDFATQDMLLLLNNGVYFEFLPMEEWAKEQPKAVPLSAVELGKNYAVIISTNAGLWRYSLGDTVAFTSISPYKIKITGRTRQFVNAFGEEVMVENTDQALAKTCAATGAVVLEYSVAPVYFKGGDGKGGHEWLVEFEKMPRDMKAFSRLLDENLQKLNSDYEAKRFQNMAMSPLQLQPVPPGTFHNWLKMKGKYGGQHKVPRLSNDRKYMEEIMAFLKKGEFTMNGGL